MTLYRNFASKDDLILAFLQRREERWTRAWLQAEAEARADTPAGAAAGDLRRVRRVVRARGLRGLLVHQRDARGRRPRAPVRQATVEHLTAIRAYVADLAEQAGVPAEEADAFARQWHILMKGSIVAAAEGDHAAGTRARELERSCSRPAAVSV